MTKINQQKKSGKHYGILEDTINNFEIINCKNCKFRHIIPIPSTKELKKYYESHFYETRKPDYFEKQKSEEIWWNLVYKERYEKFETLLKKTKKKRILDLGSGPGFFLKFGKERGWNVLGLEPSPSAVQFTRKQGIEVIAGELTEKNVSEFGKFEVIHMQGVMEHLPDPKKIIKLCKRLLVPGGILFTRVSNDYNPLQTIVRQLYNCEPWWLVPPEHINYFSVDSLKTLVESIGLSSKYVTTTFPMELFLLMGYNYIKNDSLGRKCHDKSKKLEFAFEQSNSLKLKQQIYQQLAKLGIGRNIEGFFKKNV